jgi:hypothetical protein
MDANDRPARSPDEVCAARTRPVQLDLRVLDGDHEADELPLVLVRGTAEALRFMADLLTAVADSPTKPSRFQLAPNAAGRFHFSSAADAGLYIECLSDEAAESDIEL